MYFHEKYITPNYEYEYLAESIRSFHIVQLICIAIQLLYLNLFFSEKSIPISDVVGEDNTTIYLTEHTTQTKLLLFVAGLYNQDYTCYMEKMYRDLDQIPTIREKYMFMVYNNNMLTNFDIAEPVSRHVEKIVGKYGLDGIMILGFSAGGVVATHIMSKLKHLNVEKKIVTYDCPLDIYSMLNNHYSSYCRLDILFYFVVCCFYEINRYDALKKTLANCICNGGDEPAVLKLAEKIHGMSREEIVHISQINIDQDEFTQLFFVNCIGDPVFQEDARSRFVELIGQKMKYPAKIYEKETIGHCSDMAFGNGYIDQLREIMV